MGNKKSNVSFEEFCNIAMVMKEVPKKRRENQRDYFERLNERYLKTKRSRYVLQRVVYSLKKEPEDLEKAYEIYMEYRDNNTEEKNARVKNEEKNPDKDQYKWVQELGLLRRQNELLQEQIAVLKLISGKMAFLVEQLS